jgi:hypothetical protein
LCMCAGTLSPKAVATSRHGIKSFYARTDGKAAR